MRAHKILDSLQKIDGLDESGQKYLEYLHWLIIKAEKFAFQSDGFPEPRGVYWQNLPYPEVYFEVEVSDYGRPVYVVFVAEQKEKDAPIHCYCLASENDNPKEIRPQNIIIDMSWDEESQKFGFEIGIATKVGNRATEQEIGSEGQRIGARLLVICQLINCTNVELKTNHAPEALNKKRIKKGKHPLFEYKTLQIRHGEKGKSGFILEGERNSPRLHLRRGHIRRHPTAGNIWVRNCVVGSEEKGIIEKEYKVAI